PLSIVVPARNAAADLYSCLNSPGVKQAKAVYEIVVVDNASTDSTAEIATSLGFRVVTASRPCPAAARNAGIAGTASEYIAFLDADCFASSGWITALLQGICENKLDACGGAINWVGGTPARRRFYNASYPRNVDLQFGRYPYVLTANAIFRRAALCDVGGFDASLRWCEDVDLGSRLSRAGYRIGSCPR